MSECLLCNTESFRVSASRTDSSCGELATFVEVANWSATGGLSTRRLHLFSDCRRFLAFAVAQVIQFGAASASLLFNFHLRDARRMKRKHPLDSFAIRNAAHGKRLVQPAAFAADNDAGKNLNSFLVAFHYPRVHANAVADLEVRHVALQLFLFDCVDNAAHNDFLLPAGGRSSSFAWGKKSKERCQSISELATERINDFIVAARINQRICY